MKNGKFQVKDIPDWVVIECVKKCTPENYSHYAIFWDMERMLPFIPTKLLRAKCISLVNKGILRGCEGQHNCRGDFEVV